MALQNTRNQLADAERRPVLELPDVSGVSSASVPLSVDECTTSPQPRCIKADPWIFRDGRTVLSGQRALNAISAALSNSSSDAITDALIQAGELEAGVADSGFPAAPESAQLTDTLAGALCGGDSREKARALLEVLRIPEQVCISPPEGFTYYALHPLDFRDAVAQLPTGSQSVAVIGIRSIGTTLGAVVLASIKQERREASRITVRPTGHPYSRTMNFTDVEKRWISTQSHNGADFVVVDEGPGRSGSTFLSVAEALVECGVAAERITLLGSRQPDPASLLAEGAANRWARFRFIAASSSISCRFARDIYAGGGCWRSLLLEESQDWPDSWTDMERLKFVSPDRRTIFKFEGMGRVGAEIRVRAFALAEAGFSPSVTNAGDGFLAYDLLNGRALTLGDRKPDLLDFMASYCAFRAANFCAKSNTGSQLKEMLDFNLLTELGHKVRLPEHVLSTSRPVFVDGRMQPHEWVRDGRRGIQKTDATSHGDDHFFPGPCDIAWDLAGIGVEWRLRREQSEYLLRKFEQLSGMSKTAERLPAYKLAYAVFRSGFCKMASESVSDSAEQVRLRFAYQRYRKVVEELLVSQFRNG